MAWFSPARWLLILLSVLALYVGHHYDRARAVSRAVDMTRAEYAAAALVESEANRVKEQVLIAENEKVRHEYAQEKARLIAAGRVNADRLRDLHAVTSAASPVNSDAEPTGGADADPRLGIIAECASALVTMDGYAQSLASQTRGLQNYVTDLCVAPR